MSLLTSHLSVSWSLSLALLQLACGHEWTILKKANVYISSFSFALVWLQWGQICFNYILHFSSTHVLIRHICHPWSVYVPHEYVFYVLRLNKDECNIKPYTEQDDQRLFNPTMAQPQRSWLVLFSCTPQFCPDSGPKAKTIRFAFLSANTVKYWQRPLKTQCHGPQNFFTLCIIALLASQEFRNYALLPLHLIYISDRAVILTQKWTTKEERMAAGTPPINYILLFR